LIETVSGGWFLVVGSWLLAAKAAHLRLLLLLRCQQPVTNNQQPSLLPATNNLLFRVAAPCGNE
jgi:hypothetical protein